MLRKRKRNVSAEVVEFSVDGKDYERFERFATARHLTRDDALKAVLIEGMKRYWPQQLAFMENDYSGLKKRFEEYSRDNEILGEIYSQNQELRRLVEAPRTEGRGK